MDALVWHKEYKNLDCDTELVVPVAHEAVFIKDGQVTDSFAMGRHFMRESCVGTGRLFHDEGEKVSCRVYYVKKEGAYSIKWNTPRPILITDPVLKIPVEFDIGGVFSIKIIDSKRFLSRLLAFTKKAALDEMKEFFRGRMLIYINDQLLAALAESKTSVIELPRKLMSISKDLELRMRYIFETFGISIEGFMLKKVELISGGEKEEVSPVCGLAGDGDAAGGGGQVGDGEPKPCITTSAGEVMYCPLCGVDLPPLSVYCHKCGAKVGE